jgi:hypothetical protein
MAETLLRVNRLDVSFATHQGVVSPCGRCRFRSMLMKRSVLLANPAVAKASPSRR